MGTSAADEGEGIFWEPARQEPANFCVQSVTASGLEASMTPYKIMYEVIGDKSSLFWLSTRSATSNHCFRTGCYAHNRADDRRTAQRAGYGLMSQKGRKLKCRAR